MESTNPKTLAAISLLCGLLVLYPSYLLLFYVSGTLIALGLAIVLPLGIVALWLGKKARSTGGSIATIGMILGIISLIMVALKAIFIMSLYH
jgi:hypothetical protein